MDKQRKNRRVSKATFEISLWSLLDESNKIIDNLKRKQHEQQYELDVELGFL